MKIKYLSVVKVKNKFVSDYSTLFPSNEIYIWLGEIPNMLGHCVVANFWSGRIYSGYHCDIFRLAKEDEI